VLESYCDFEKNIRRSGCVLAAGLMMYFLILSITAGTAWSHQEYCPWDKNITDNTFQFTQKIE
tara:strand:+ start:335 stop:523 length:189 start_codon:yes stop_codon:yes gene_type:complete